MLALEGEGRGWISPGQPGTRFRRCRNDLDYGICNWLIEDSEADTQVYCTSSRRNQVIPDLSQPYNPVYWARLEAAERLLIDALLAVDLPMDPSGTAPGMRFAFLADEPSAGENSLRMVTGHTAGLITINVAEADPAHRDELRVCLGEPYRTLIGHMRHESGHYYWARLAPDPVWLALVPQLNAMSRALGKCDLYPFILDRSSPPG